MADGVKIMLSGREDLVAAFQRFRNELPKDPTRKPVKAAADYLAAEVQRAIPEKLGRPTGRLMAAIRTSVSRSKGATHGKITIDRGLAYYWRFLELGWHAHGQNRHFFQYAFIMPTVRRLQQKAGQIVINGCEREIKKVADRMFKQFIRSV